MVKSQDDAMWRLEEAETKNQKDRERCLATTTHSEPYLKPSNVLEHGLDFVVCVMLIVSYMLELKVECVIFVIFREFKKDTAISSGDILHCSIFHCPSSS